MEIKVERRVRGRDAKEGERKRAGVKKRLITSAA